MISEIVPMYVPSIAVFGVLKPNPTSLYHLRPPFPTLVLFVRFVFWLTKICGCFWKARSDCTVNSVAMIADHYGRADGGVEFVWEAKSLAKSISLSDRHCSLAWLGKIHCLQSPRVRRALSSYSQTQQQSTCYELVATTAEQHPRYSEYVE